MIEETRRCKFKECQKEFVANRRDKFYCSVKCRDTAYRRKREWMTSGVEVMVRCANQTCGRWFVSKSAKGTFCSQKCGAQTANRRRDGNPSASRQNDVFVCPECGKLAKRRSKASKTCGSRKCLNSYARKWRTPEYQSKPKPEEKVEDRSGWRNCLGWCDKKFWSEDKTLITYCPKCRHIRDAKQHTYRFAPAGW
jgi:hypothetical protein